MYTHSPKVSHNHEGTNKGYMYITNISLNQSIFVGKLGKGSTLFKTSTETFTSDGYHVSVLVTNNVTNIPHYNLGWNPPKPIPT